MITKEKLRIYKKYSGNIQEILKYGIDSVKKKIKAF